MSLSYTLNPSSLTSFPNSGGMLPVSCQQFHGASCGSNPRERAYTYRIANFSVGSSDIRSPVWWARRSFAHRVAAVSGQPYLGLRGGAQYANPFRQTADTLQHAIERAG